LLTRDESILKISEEELFWKEEGKIIKWKWREEKIENEVKE
jgi:hypothetical protein